MNAEEVADFKEKVNSNYGWILSHFCLPSDLKVYYSDSGDFGTYFCKTQTRPPTIYIFPEKHSSFYSCLHTLFHELQHAHQYETKQLIPVGEKHVAFKGQSINRKNVEYCNYPWEIDANNVAYDLVYKFQAREMETLQAMLKKSLWSRIKGIFSKKRAKGNK